jgi:hypothetical protein
LLYAEIAPGASSLLNQPFLRISLKYFVFIDVCLFSMDM